MVSPNPRIPNPSCVWCPRILPKGADKRRRSRACSRCETIEGKDGGGDPMKQLIAVALVFSLALPAWPEIRPPPPPPDDDVPQLPREVPPVEEMGYFESCFGVPRVG